MLISVCANICLLKHTLFDVMTHSHNFNGAAIAIPQP